MNEEQREESRELARREVAAAPPLTQHQRDRLREIFAATVTRPEPSSPGDSHARE